MRMQINYSMFKLSACSACTCSKHACFESCTQRVNGCADDHTQSACPNIKQALSPIITITVGLQKEKKNK